MKAYLNFGDHLGDTFPIRAVRQAVHRGSEVGRCHDIVQMQVVPGVEGERRGAALGPGPEGRAARGLLVGREVVEELLDLVGVLSLPVEPRPRHAVGEVQRPVVYGVLK